MHIIVQQSQPLEGFTKSIALEVGSRGITANTISPGYIATDMTKGINES